MSWNRMRDKSSALEASERSMRESISGLLDWVSAGEFTRLLAKGKQEMAALSLLGQSFSFLF